MTKPSHPPVFHPLLLAVHPVIALALYNAQTAAVGDVLPTLLGVAASAALLYAVLSAVLHDRAKAGLILSLFLLLFFSYGHVRDLLSPTGAEIPLQRTGRVLLPLWMGIMAAGALAVIRTRSIPSSVTTIANVFAVVIVGIPLVVAAPTALNRGMTRSRIWREIDARSALPSTRPRPPLRDIYYIILDTYPNSHDLQRITGRDNRAFTDSLERRGFAIAHEARANYPHTFQSLASSLNMHHLTFLSPIVGRDASDRLPVYRMMENHMVGRMLKGLGYTYLHIGSWFPPTRTNPLADENLTGSIRSYKGLVPSMSEFNTKLLRTTALFPLLARFFPVGLESIHRELVLHGFDQLRSAAAYPGPKFVFAHILLPHLPFVFGPSGEDMRGRQPISEEESFDRYMDQVAYANTRMLEIVDCLLAGTAIEPIVVLQSDEGSWLCPGCSTTDARELRAGILNALYLPHVPDGTVYDSLTPVNTFRLIANNYFGAELPLLPDETWDFEDPLRPYDLHKHDAKSSLD